MPFDASASFQAEFRAASARFPTGVTVVTRRFADGRPHGMTVSSFTSVSLEPPLILVCIDKRANFAADLAAGMPFAVNVLSHEQQPLAARFATAAEAERFAGVDWSETREGVPLLAGAVAIFECQVADVISSGDHWIVVGRVSGMRRHEGRPLIWCDSGYHWLPIDRPV